MNTPGYIFLLTGFLVLKALMIPGATATVFGTPTLATIDPVQSICVDNLHLGVGTTGTETLVHCLTDNFSTDISCHTLFCYNTVAAATVDVAVALFDILIVIAILVLVALNVIIFIFEIGAIIVALAVAQIPGAPVYVNMLLIGIPIIMLGIQLVNMLKPGSKADTE